MTHAHALPASFPTMVAIKDMLAELMAQPLVSTRMLNLLSTWVTATVEARGPTFGVSDDTWEADVDLSAGGGYIAMLQDKLANGGPADPFLTVADVRAFVGRPANRRYLPMVSTTLMRTAQHIMGRRTWPAPVVGSREELVVLEHDVEEAQDEAPLS